MAPTPTPTPIVPTPTPTPTPIPIEPTPTPTSTQPPISSNKFISCCGQYIVQNDFDGVVGQTYSSECDGSCWTCITPESAPRQTASLALVFQTECSNPFCTDCISYTIINTTGTPQFFDYVDCEGNEILGFEIADGNDIQI
ncbi:MAG: hypothetical protein ACK56F_13390, partial [bacterium]